MRVDGWMVSRRRGGQCMSRERGDTGTHVRFLREEQRHGPQPTVSLLGPCYVRRIAGPISRSRKVRESQGQAL